MFVTTVRLYAAALSVVVAIMFSGTGPARVRAQSGGSADAKRIYDHIKAFTLDGHAIEVNNLLLKRDRAEMTLTGTIYLSAPVEGREKGRARPAQLDSVGEDDDPGPVRS